ncbi:P-loop containing nucleoside triphosphate hydrolase protein, partial [Athelia psychrophila]
FGLKGQKTEIPKGTFVTILGRIGSGVSLYLDKRLLVFSFDHGGSVAYSPRTPWGGNATLRENILLGNKMTRKGLETLPHGELIEIGEKGTNLSGKARVFIARAAYSRSDIVLLDDPLSAVGAHVRKAILDNCIFNVFILVTHALHFLNRTDYIYVMDNGIISEHETYRVSTC